MSDSSRDDARRDDSSPDETAPEGRVPDGSTSEDSSPNAPSANEPPTEESPAAAEAAAADRDAPTADGDVPTVARDEQWQVEIDRLQNLQGEIRRLSAAKFVELDHLKGCYQWLDELRGLRSCGRLIGESQTGKTVACRVYHLRANPRRRDDRRSALYLRLPPQTTPRSLWLQAAETLETAGDGPGHLHELRGRVLADLRDRGIRIVIADNADRQPLAAIAELQYLAEQANLSVVLAGTPELAALLKRDDGLQETFRPRWTLPRLGGNGLEAAIALWERDVLKLPDPSRLSEGDAVGLLADATDGRVGRLDAILRRAAIRALKRGLRAIDPETLEAIVSEYL